MSNKLKKEFWEEFGHVYHKEAIWEWFILNLKRFDEQELENRIEKVILEWRNRKNKNPRVSTDDLIDCPCCGRSRAMEHYGNNVYKCLWEDCLSSINVETGEEDN